MPDHNTPLAVGQRWRNEISGHVWIINRIIEHEISVMLKHERGVSRKRESFGYLRSNYTLVER